MAHPQRRTVESALRRFRRCHLDTQTAAAEQEVEGEPSQCLWQPWREAEQAVLQAQAAGPRDERRPGPRQRGQVETVPHLCARSCRSRNAPLQGVVGELELLPRVARLLLWGERVATQVHREDEVGLLDDLLVIEVEVWEVQEQGVLVRRGVSEVPDLVFGKGFVLRGHSQALVVGDEHLLGCLAEVGVDVVVGEGAVLVGSGDAVDAEPVGGGVEVPERMPQPRRLDEQLEAHLLLERAVTGRLDVGGHSVGDVRVDMEGSGTRAGQYHEDFAP